MDDVSKITLDLLDLMFRDFESQFDFRLWNGEQYIPPLMKDRKATVVINNPAVLACVFAFPVDLKLGEAFIYKDIDVEGDIFSIFPAEAYLTKRYKHLVANPKFWFYLAKLMRLCRRDSKYISSFRGPAVLKGRRHSIERDKAAVSYHYNLPSEFYSLYLDPLMNYSCAYFRSFEDDLYTAQLNKLELICRKLRLKEGERVLDIGCGWGGFVLYAAKNYRVKVLGITLAENQVEYAKRKIKEMGLERFAEVRLQDYRELEDGEGFDKIVSIGMFEHVGKSMLKTYFKKAYQLLKPKGLFLNHGIAAKWGFFRTHLRRFFFVERYVFPDGHLLPINYTLKVAEDVGFEVRDVESLREHYALTLRHWVNNLSKNKEKALKVVDEVTYRVWYLYMAGASYGFEINQQSVFQVLLAKNDKNGKNDLPLTREDIYSSWGQGWGDLNMEKKR